MSILSVDNLSHGFGDRAIFRNVTFRLLAGEHVGLVGANGEGKSTFMSIITGHLMPDEGTITWAKHTHAGYLDQHTELKSGMTIRDVLASAFAGLYEKEREMNEICERMADADDATMESLLEEMGVLQEMLEQHDFYNIDPKIDEIAHAFELDQLGLDKDVSALSGGQRTKVLLAKLLLERPDVLLLDEPTNYLDKQHIDWLTGYLQNYDNAFILVSHDVAFMNSVVNVIYHVQDTQLTRYAGNYEKFTEVYEMRRGQIEAAYNRQQQEIKELKDFVARNKSRVATRNMAMSRQKKLEKMDMIELAKEKPKPEFRFKEARVPSRVVIETKDLVIGYGTPLSRPVTMKVERGEKLVLRGANGIGKTTLLKSILGMIPTLGGTVTLGDYLAIGYFEQETDKDFGKTCMEALWDEYPGYTNYEVRSALAKCGLTTEQIESRVQVLSGGEQSKLRLCKLLNRASNLLILDEPTNHLDVEAKEELKHALSEYNGTILMVCHEPEFYESFVTQVMDCSTWSLLV